VHATFNDQVAATFGDPSAPFYFNNKGSFVMNLPAGSVTNIYANAYWFLTGTFTITPGDLLVFTTLNQQVS
jgi:hypothetical protein